MSHRFYSTHSASFLKPAAYITHNATEPLCDITGESLSDDMQLPPEPQKALNNTSHICSSSPQHLLAHFNT